MRNNVWLAANQYVACHIDFLFRSDRKTESKSILHNVRSKIHSHPTISRKFTHSIKHSIHPHRAVCVCNVSRDLVMKTLNKESQFVQQI